MFKAIRFFILHGRSIMSLGKPFAYQLKDIETGIVSAIALISAGIEGVNLFDCQALNIEFVIVTPVKDVMYTNIQ